MKLIPLETLFMLNNYFFHLEYLCFGRKTLSSSSNIYVSGAYIPKGYIIQGPDGAIRYLKSCPPHSWEVVRGDSTLTRLLTEPLQMPWLPRWAGLRTVPWEPAQHPPLIPPWAVCYSRAELTSAARLPGLGPGYRFPTVTLSKLLHLFVPKRPYL